MVTYYSEVTPKDVEWLWYPYIPFGKITLLQGDPGEGKSTFAIQVASVITKGGVFPDGYEMSHPENVIYQCAEDGAEDTIKPRLLKAGADCDRIAFIPEDEDRLVIGDQRLEEAIAASKARCLILDPIQSYVAQDSDMHSAQKMRKTLSKLAEIAEKYGCAIILIGHMTKASGAKQLYRGLGSIDIAAIARSVLMVARDTEQAEVRYMFPVKSSLSPEGDAIGFLLDRNTGFHWLGRCTINKEELTSNDGEVVGKKERAKELLKIILSAGSVPSSEVYSKLWELGIGERTARSAVKEMKIKAERKGQVWYMKLKEK